MCSKRHQSNLSSCNLNWFPAGWNFLRLLLADAAAPPKLPSAWYGCSCRFLSLSWIMWLVLQIAQKRQKSDMIQHTNQTSQRGTDAGKGFKECELCLAPAPGHTTDCLGLVCACPLVSWCNEALRSWAFFPLRDQATKVTTYSNEMKIPRILAKIKCFDFLKLQRGKQSFYSNSPAELEHTHGDPGTV